MDFIGIDVGGTKCLGVVVDESGTIIREIRVLTPDASQLIDTLCDLVLELSSSEVSGIGIGLPGLVRSDGVFCTSPHIKGIDNLHVVDAIYAKIGHNIGSTKLCIDNDATAAAFAEWKIGAARGVHNAIVVTLGTGIGGGIIAGGQMYRGTQGFAGEFGHFVVEVGGRSCVCGQRGCWETYASGSALDAMWSTGDGRDVMAAHAAGDTTAHEVVNEFSRWVATGLATLVNVCDPASIVIGGGLASASDQFLDIVSVHLYDQVYGHHYRQMPQVVPAQLGEKAGAIGSALMVALQ